MPLVLTQVVMPRRVAVAQDVEEVVAQERLAAPEVDLEDLHARQLVERARHWSRSSSPPAVRAAPQLGADRQWLQSQVAGLGDLPGDVDRGAQGRGAQLLRLDSPGHDEQPLRDEIVKQSTAAATATGRRPAWRAANVQTPLAR